LIDIVSELLGSHRFRELFWTPCESLKKFVGGYLGSDGDGVLIDDICDFLISIVLQPVTVEEVVAMIMTVVLVVAAGK
jgi:hypothetical protein